MASSEPATAARLVTCLGCHAKWMGVGPRPGSDYDAIRCTCPVGSEPEFVFVDAPATAARQPASVRGKCPRCGGIPTNDRHYPDGYGDYPKPVNRYYCAPCDTEWWV